MENLLEIKSLNTYYGESHILRDVDLNVKSGEMVCLIGRNGVGKTTLTANLGIALANSGASTAVLDADFGLRNLDLLLGLENRIIYTAQDVLDKNCRLDQALVDIKRNLILLFYLLEIQGCWIG